MMLAAFGGAVLMAGCRPPALITGEVRTAFATEVTAPTAPQPAATAKPDESTTAGGIRRIVGRLVTPALGLIANDSAGLTDVGSGIFLTDVGGGMFYRTLQAVSRAAQGVDQTALEGARVTLETPDGQALGSAVGTDATGSFVLELAPTASGSLVVRSRFEAQGQTFDFRTRVEVPATGTATADVDLATTLVTDALLAVPDRRDLFLAIKPASFAELVVSLRGSLTPEQVPYLAQDTTDRLATFDQLVADLPALAAAAAKASPRLAARATDLQVTTLFDAAALARLGLIADDATFGEAGNFEVDATGDLYMPTLAASPDQRIAVVRLTQAGATHSHAVLPVGYVSPLLQDFAADGTYWAAALEASSSQVHVFKGGPAGLERQPGVLITLPDDRPRRLGGRITVGPRGAVACALTLASVVIVKAPGQDGRIVAGTAFMDGYGDGIGAAARFDRPMGAVFGPDGAAYVADENNRAIRRIAASGLVTTVAGGPDGDAYRNGRGIHARFGSPESLAVAGKTVFVADTRANRIRRISPSGSVFDVAGTGASGLLDGPAAQATMARPRNLEMDGAGNLYFRDFGLDPATGKGYNVIRRIGRP
ncbi:MAG: hypothetical protein VKP57_01525 [Candidatus Sericytochromatia bacterium]|nr:hypothetical protein [Candidatus Sericytochromatia bacterium]